MRRRGFTLIEVLVAFFIISCCAGGILLALVLNLAESKDSREQIMARMLASSAIDELRAHRFGSEDGPPGWTDTGQGWSRTVTVATIVAGMPSPSEFQLKLTPQPAQHGQGLTPGEQLVTLDMAWQETSGPKTLSFDIPMPVGWNQPVQRGDQPDAVAANWHSPADYDVSSEPSYKHGDADHSVTPNVPSGDDVTNNDPEAKKRQGLLDQLNKLGPQLVAAKKAVAADQDVVKAAQQALTDAQNANPPDQTAITAAQTALTNAQGQLKTDTDTANDLQAQVDEIQKELSEDPSSSPSPSP